MLKKLIFSFALVGILLGSFKGYTVYAQDDSGSEVTTTLNAAVSEGLLTVLTYDTESGVKNIYIKTEGRLARRY